MKTLVRLALAAAALLVLIFGGIMGISETGGEVITLRTTAADGTLRETRLWIVDDAGTLWLRAGQPANQWLVDVRQEPEVEVVQSGNPVRYRAVPIETPEARTKINELMAEDYGMAEALIALIHDDDQVVPIRLEPHVAAGTVIE